MKLKHILNGPAGELLFQIIFIISWLGGFFSHVLTRQVIDSLPPEIPLYYYLPTGQRLAPKTDIWHLNILILSVLIANTLITLVFLKKQRIFSYVTMIITLLIELFALLTLNQIISVGIV